MQEPTPRDGGIIKSAWLEQTRYKTLPDERIRIIQSWDTAYKAAQINDPSACTTWLQTKTRYYLIEAFTMRGEYPAVKRAIQSKWEQYRPDAVLIEDKASGQSLIQELNQTQIPIIAIKPEGDKETRLNAVSSEFEAGKVFLPEAAHWLIPYEAELFAFPKGKHDDQVDSTSQALMWMRGKSGQTIAWDAMPINEGVY
jgi:predicted phage terminase large subunit-like protein